MKLLLKSVVFFVLAVWLAESAPAGLDSSSNNVKERRSETDLLQDLLSSVEQQQQQGEETLADTSDDKEGDDDDDDDAAIMSTAEAEMVRGLLEAGMEDNDAQIMTAFNDDDDDDDDSTASIEWQHKLWRGRSYWRRRRSICVRRCMRRYYG